jgi:hypothetical protein
VGCLLAGFYLLRVHDNAVATVCAVALNVGVAGVAWMLARNADASEKNSNESGATSPVMADTPDRSGATAEAQTDEADLMPYDFLESVEDSAIRDKHTPTEVLQELLPRYPEQSPQQLAQWIERFFRLWCQNQWKRERFAPSFHLDDRNVDPRSWCRFPILSGGFERELAEMRAYVSMGKAER